MMDNVLEDRTGVTKMNNVTNPQSLNKTATEVNAMSTASNQRIELIARVFAETGVTELFRKIIKLGSQHAEKSTMLRLQGKFVAVDPRTWKNQFDVTVNVGLGSGNKDQVVQHMMLVLQAQEKAIQLGLADPKTIFEALSELTRAIGHKDVTRFWVNPASPEYKQPPPQPNPAVQVAQIKAQTDMQLGQAKLHNELQMDQARAQADAQSDMAKAQAQAQADTVKTNNDLRERLTMHASAQDTAIKIAKIGELGKIKVAQIAAATDNGDELAEQLEADTGDPRHRQQEQDRHEQIVNGLSQLAGHMQNLHRTLSTPTEIVRGPDGRALGTRKVA